MSSYEHILVPTDFSEFSARAAARAADLAKLTGARLSVLHVVDYLPPGYVPIPNEIAAPEKVVERAEAYLTEWLDKVGLQGAEQIVNVGPAKRKITETAKERGVDLIVIGGSGAGGVKLLLGSTTNAVLHDAPCDVLSIHST